MVWAWSSFALITSDRARHRARLAWTCMAVLLTFWLATATVPSAASKACQLDFQCVSGWWHPCELEGTKVHHKLGLSEVVLFCVELCAKKLSLSSKQ
jgi:hypothetical protein